MKRTILLIAVLVLLPNIVWGAAAACSTAGGGGGICYVDMASSGGNGTTTATSGANAAFQHIAEVNALTYAAGDQILFKRGATWRETLTVSTGGGAGNVITIGAYGTGANPKFVGSAVKDVTGATLTVVADTEIYTQNAGAEADDGAERNLRSRIAAAGISADATAIKIRVYATAGNNLTIDGTAIGPYAGSGDDYDASALTRITWDVGSNTTTITAGSYKDSDAITYALDNAVDQIVTMYMTQRHYTGTGGTNTLYYKSTTATNESQTANATGYSSVSNNGFVRKIYSVGATIASTYEVAQATDAGWVWEDGVPLKKKTSIATVEGTAGSWWWDDDTDKLYIHASDSSNVATNGKVYEIYSLDHNIDTNGKNYLTIDGIDCIRTAGADATLGGIKVTGTNTTVQNLTSSDHRRHALSFYTGATSGLATNCTFANSYSTTPVTIYDTANLCVLQNSEIYNTAITPNNGCIVVHGGADNNTIQNNLIHDAGITGSANYLINMYDAGTTNLVIRYNKFYGVFSSAIRPQAATGVEIYYNIFVTSSGTGSIISLDASTGSTIYNNTFYGTLDQFALAQINNSTGTLFKNNIVYNGKYVSVANGSHTDSAYDYNLYYGGSGNYFNWTGTDYATFANWKTNSSQDAASLNSDPLFINAAASDFRLRPASPAKDTGADVSLTTDYQGRTVPKMGGVDMGAYEYPSIGQSLQNNLNLLWLGK